MNNIEIVKGSLLNVSADVIVTPANNDLTQCDGINKKIFYIAGPGLVKACENIKFCETGKAVITCGYNTEVEYIIHTVGPYWYGGFNKEAETLASCYKSSLLLAEENEFSSIAFPSICTGNAKYPVEEAAEIAIFTIKEFIKEHNSEIKVFIVCNDHDTWLQYRKANENQELSIDKYFNRTLLLISESINDKESSMLKKRFLKKGFPKEQLVLVANSVLNRVSADKHKNIILLDERYTKEKITDEICNKYHAAGAYVTYDMIENIQLNENIISFHISPYINFDFYKK